jgi:hypothetical protein
MLYFVVVDPEAPVTLDTAETVSVWRGDAANGVPDNSYVLEPTDTSEIPVPKSGVAVIVTGLCDCAVALNRRDLSEYPIFGSLNGRPTINE